MPFDHGFLVMLRPDDPEDWALRLHQALVEAPNELTGALLFREGQPLAVVRAPLVDLHACAASPGGLLGKAVWFGADAILPFHTQVTASGPAEIEDEDLFYAQRLRDLAQLVGGLEVLDHLIVGADPEPVWLGQHENLRPPVALDEMEGWTRQRPAPREPNLRHPVTGELAVPGGKRPNWVREALEIGFLLEDLQLPAGLDLDAPNGLPPGLGLFRSVALNLGGGALPPPGFREVSADGGGFEVSPEAESLARAISSLEAEREPLVGVVLVGDDDRVTAPRAGLVAPESVVGSHPGRLFASALRDGATWGMTFSVLPGGVQPFTAERRDLMRRLIFAGRLMGLSVQDHLVVTTGGTGWTSLRSTPLWRWPNVPPLDEAPWPPFRRTRQTARVVQHPHDGRRWDERGTMPGWVERLVNGGWALDELRIYR